MHMARRLRSSSIVLLSVLLLLCVSGMVCLQSAQAASPLVGVALALLDNTMPIEMIGLTVDVQLRAAQGRTFADVSTRYQLHNRDRLEGYEVPLGFPRQLDGPARFDPTSQSGLRLTADGKPVAPAPDGRYADWQHVFAADGKLVVEMDYVVDLGDDPIITVRYDPTPAAEWATLVDGIQIRFHLPKPKMMEQIVEIEPDTMTFDGQAVTWQAEYAEPNAPLVVRIISPPIWDQIVTTQHAIFNSPGLAEHHYTLASLYLLLDPPESAASVPDLYAATLALLLEVEELDPDFVPAYLDTVRLYQARARERSDIAPHYLALAAEQLDTALIYRPNDEALRTSLAQMYLQLAIATRTEREYDLAWSYFEKSLDLVPEANKPAYEERIAEEIRTTSMAWTASLLEEGRVEEALALARERLGVDLIGGYRSHKPRLALVQGDVTTIEGERRITLELTPYVVDDTSELADHLSGITAQLAATGVASVHLAPAGTRYSLTLTIPFLDTQDLLYRLGTLETALPLEMDPSLDLLRAVLQPRNLVLQRWETPVGIDVDYLEEVDLEVSATVLLEAQQNTQWALMDLQGQDPQDEQGKALRRLALGLLQEYERVWGRQIKENGLHYQLSLSTPSGDTQHREWDLDMGGVVTDDFVTPLSWQGSIYDVRATIRFAAILIASLGLLIWLFGLLRSRLRVENTS